MLEFRLVTTDNDGRTYDQQVSDLQDGLERGLYYLTNSNGTGWAELHYYVDNALRATLPIHPERILVTKSTS